MDTNRYTVYTSSRNTAAVDAGRRETWVDIAGNEHGGGGLGGGGLVTLCLSRGRVDDIVVGYLSHGRGGDELGARTGRG